MKRITEERDRRCDGCSWVGTIYFVAFGSKSWRMCGPCWHQLERMRVRLHTENLDAVETR